MSKPTRSRLAENIMAKVETLEKQALTAMKKGVFDRDYYLNLILQKAEQLQWHNKPEMVEQVLDVYQTVQEYGYDGIYVDENARKRNSSKKSST